ncbi:MAG: GntR family transcriptional regulator [Bacteroidales bacterium]|nr:GntR family transcriptional regulator [Bacteroidales bacterium]
MIVNKEIPIFLQLAENIKSQIIEGKLKKDDRIMSVRDIAATYEVNNNTAMKSVNTLAEENIIYQKRGMGYFVTEKAKEIIEEQRRRLFYEKELPILRKVMTQLGITKEELMSML